MTNQVLEEKCIDFLRNHLIGLDKYIVNTKEEDEKLQLNDERKNDIHNNHKTTISADFRVLSKDRKKYTFFEVKSTNDKDELYGRISFNQICAALDAREKGYEYYFVIIRLSYGKCFFICPEDRETPFLSLKDVLEYSTGSYYLGIDIHQTWGKLRKRMKLYKSNTDNVWILPPQNKKRYNEDNMKSIRTILNKIDRT